ncbi:MAG TPA: DUF4382 domain-containing protein [Terriglobales bacterium]|jgi:hypothetical protein|nr:DUF4382 domain-containing protein [Terriglobales bacterium]
MSRYWMAAGSTAVLALSIAFLVACSGSSTSMQTASAATTMITISDPATCSSGTGGPFGHVYVTVTDVQIHASASAGDNDSNWIDLTPNLKSSPQQIDLLGQANNQCFLASLGSTTELQPGSYQQIRVMLAPNNAAASGDKCNGTANCVVLSADNSVHTLLLSSESKTGLKIPAGQIAGGNFTVAAGQTKDLNIDFNTCASIVTQGNGQYRLKPVLHAGEVSTTSTSINGKLVDKTTGQAIVGGKAIVALEQKDASGIDRVVMQVTPDNTGAFVFCPVPAGSYDVVAVAINGANVAYATTIATGVTVGAALGNVQMFPTTGTNTGPGSITGTVTTATAAPAAGTVADLTISALQQVGSLNVTIPLAQQSSATATLTAQAGATCPANTDCATYTLSVPGVNPTVGAFSANGTNYVTGASGAASYTVEAQAFVPQSGGKIDCTNPVMTTPAISVSPGSTPAQAPTLAFTGCQ